MDPMLTNIICGVLIALICSAVTGVVGAVLVLKGLQVDISWIKKEVAELKGWVNKHERQIDDWFSNFKDHHI